MKTAEEYWGIFRDTCCRGLLPWEESSDNRRGEFERFVETIAADALAEKPAAPDADEERAKREHTRWRDSFVSTFSEFSWGDLSEEGKARWKAYAKTVERPMRSPGRVLADALFDSGFLAGFRTTSWNVLRESEKSDLEAAATALGIHPRE